MGKAISAQATIGDDGNLILLQVVKGDGLFDEWFVVDKAIEMNLSFDGDDLNFTFELQGVPVPECLAKLLSNDEKQ